MRNSSRGAVDPFIVMDVMESARRAEASGRHIIHMEVGQPSAGAPQEALDALASRMQSDPLGYTVALGLPELRARIARHYGERHGVDLDPARVAVTPGSSGGFVLAFTALFDAGDRVALGRPGYPSYRQILKALDLVPAEIEAAASNGYQLVPQDLEGVDFQGLLMASPANPTGTMLGRDALGALIDVCKGRNAAFLSDEIYHGIEHETPSVSALELSDDVCVINSFSKYFCMTGWRVGWLVVPEGQVRQIERLAQNLFICPPHAAQVAALHAMDAVDALDANLAVYARNRAMMLRELPGIGFDRIAPPDGAFYIYADVGDLTQDSRAFAAEILEKAGVAVTPGLDFDPARGHGTLRFSYARDTAEIAEGLDRLKAFMAAR
ncbi:1-aminocyclopropane-1-carboxylate deaminase [Salipiger aestuarii]|uniref:aspartate transaminase n=1 Tax=Salipiger aestuarii TaxID=568098 RepID=A0A327YCG3_9RHOB|nr:aminotransferase class I/II-fold pyridoxal phosphate-dependent enzyme [Salipiger aestuarii]EIE51958.1 aminotransferase, classes I and II [Citreicella sp. 357]KAA8609504.1 1-aminocyclopropane-1-carboxylate deaminase [Salipiger aestuarii]KAA8610991.1 1-aminocyclopropane-1-carboxylate deaminase [Salipiger aestuarii]KAB2542437.1 1-aminocyclopropane-1-carboxylate deaminase [Salipiger aestuarii]RAK18768.1 aspartate/methionine/tyrosine aminotransferase [Salipiger aestuarii]